MKENRFSPERDRDLMDDLLSGLPDDAGSGDDFDLAELDRLLGEPTAADDDDEFGLKALLSETPTEPAPSAKPASPSGKFTRQAPEKEASPSEDTSPRKERPGSKKTALILLCAALAVVILCVLAVLIPAAMDPYDNRILPGTTVAGVDVGGMTRSEARRAVKDAVESGISQQPMVVTLPDGVITLSPEDTGVKLNVRKAVKAAYQLGRSDTAASGTTVDVLPYLKVDQSVIRRQLESYAAEHNVPHTELSYRLEGTQPELAEDAFDASAPVQTLQLTLGTPLEELDVEQVLSEILAAYCSNRLSVTIDAIPHQTEPNAPDLEAIAREFTIEPVNSGLDLKTYQRIPGSCGYTLDIAEGERLLKEAQYGETISIPMTYVTPEIWGDGVYFREELGYCETKHTDNKDRNTNLTLACAALDGLVLQPGEEFSYNGTVGERTKEKGYKPAAAYSGTRTVNSIGGGVCQVSTTLYNAALLADMEIVFRINHGFRSSYIGVGLDATVNWGGPDFQFRNNSHFPVMIKAEVSDGFVKIKLLGTDEKDYYIKMTSGYSEDDEYVYSWSYKNKYDKETDELISKEKEAFSRYMK